MNYHCIACKRVYTNLPPPNVEAEHVCTVCRMELPAEHPSSIPQPVPAPPRPRRFGDVKLRCASLEIMGDHSNPFSLHNSNL